MKDLNYEKITVYCWLCLYIHIFSEGKESNTRKVLGISQEEHDVSKAFIFLNLVGEFCML